MVMVHMFHKRVVYNKFHLNIKIYADANSEFAEDSHGPVTTERHPLFTPLNSGSLLVLSEEYDFFMMLGMIHTDCCRKIRILDLSNLVLSLSFLIKNTHCQGHACTLQGQPFTWQDFWQCTNMIPADICPVAQLQTCDH